MLTLGSLVGGRYELVEAIGTGGMSVVYRAIDRATDEPVAVKVLQGVDPSFHQRFAREASALLQLDDPGIVRLRAEGVDHGLPYLVLDLVDGPSLAEELARGPMAEAEATRIAAAVAEALAHAHGHGFVHRDVKPANILLDEDRAPKLVDFGIALLADTPSITVAGTIVGTASYLAPEQLQGSGAGPPADVYALGLVLIEVVSGQKAFAGTPAEVAAARLVGPPTMPPTATPWLASVLSAMTALDPASRPTAAEVAHSLAAGAPMIAADPDRTAVIAEPTSVLPLPLAPVAPEFSRRRIAALVAAVVAVLALALGYVAAQSGSGDLPVEAGTTTTVVATTVPTTAAPTTEAPTTQPPRKGKGGGKGSEDG
jgi:serine/threonine protein kinase